MSTHFVIVNMYMKPVINALFLLKAGESTECVNEFKDGANGNVYICLLHSQSERAHKCKLRSLLS